MVVTNEGTNIQYRKTLQTTYLGTKMARAQESVSPGVLKRNSLITTNTRHIGNSQEALIRLIPIPQTVCIPFIPKV